MYETGSHADYGDGREASHQSKTESFTPDETQVDCCGDLGRWALLK